MTIIQKAHKFDTHMFHAALAYYRLPRTYGRFFTKGEQGGLEACNPIQFSSRGLVTWAQINQPRAGTPLKKATNKDIQFIANVTLDFEYPQEPTRAHTIGLALADYLLEHGLAEEELPVEDSGAGCHICLPIPPIETTPENAEQWNRAIYNIVKRSIEPEFKRLCEQEGVKLSLSGYDISRIFSLPGTWRPYNPEKGDHEALSSGYLRRWLPPHGKGRYPVRYECKQLAYFITEEFKRLSEPAKPVKTLPQPFPTHPSNASENPSQWLGAYAREHVTNDRSASFQALVNGLWLKFGDERIIWSLKNELNEYSANKYNGRLDMELERSLELARNLPRDEAKRSVVSKHVSKGPGEPPSPVASHPDRSFNLTDLGNAERFAAVYKENVRWCETWNTWMIFNSKAWEPDRTGMADQRAKMIVRSIYHETAKEEDETQRKKIVKHAVASESNRAVRAMLDRAKSELPTTPEAFNTHLHLVNCKNGTLDLRTGELYPHNSADMLTRCLKINYNPLASCQKWEAFIDAVFASNADLIHFMQQALGMSLSGDTSEQCLLICHGNGSNGKTTLLETVRMIMGNYGFAANIETFQVRKNEGIRNDIAELYGARLVTASENALGSRLNEAFVKKATGKEPLRARRLHENEFEFMPEFTLWLAVNHKPVVKDTSTGMWRRVHFIPFSVTFEGKSLNKHLGEELLQEAEGILAWLVQGSIEWYRNGRLTPPQVVREATQAYRQEMDVIARFLSERCIEEKGTDIGASALYAAYKLWCEETGERFEKQKAFGDSLSERGYIREKRRTGMVYLSLRLVRVNDVNDVNDSSRLSHEEKIQGEKPRNIMRNHSHHSHAPLGTNSEAVSTSVNDRHKSVNDVNDVNGTKVPETDSDLALRKERGRLLAANPREVGESTAHYTARLDALLGRETR